MSETPLAAADPRTTRWPSSERVGDQVLGVPQQLGVAVERGGHHLPLPGGGVQGGPHGVLLDLPAPLAGPVLDPAGLGELGLPDHVQAEDVQRAVLGRAAPDQLLALAVGGRREVPDLDVVLAAGGGRAVGRGGREAARRLVEDVPVQRRRAASPTGGAGAAGRQQRRRQAHEKAPTPRSNTADAVDREAHRRSISRWCRVLLSIATAPCHSIAANRSLRSLPAARCEARYSQPLSSAVRMASSRLRAPVSRDRGREVVGDGPLRQVEPGRDLGRGAAVAGGRQHLPLTLGQGLAPR
jgi:hypothetical protein